MFKPSFLDIFSVTTILSYPYVDYEIPKTIEDAFLDINQNFPDSLIAPLKFQVFLLDRRSKKKR